VTEREQIGHAEDRVGCMSCVPPEMGETMGETVALWGRLNRIRGQRD
jgi:hypothetical protein